MDAVYMDEGNTMYGSDHNATVFSLRLLVPVTEPDTEPDTEESITTPITESTAEEESTESTLTETQPQKNGCGSAILPAATLLIPLLALALRKREKAE